MHLNKKQTFINPEISVENLSKALYETSLRLAETNLLLKDANDKLHQSEVLRGELISNLSHDFRSPVSSIKSYVEYMTDFFPLEPEENLEILKQMNDKIVVLEHMLSDFFLFSSLEYTSLNLQYVTLNAWDFLNDFFYSRRKDPQYKSRTLLFEYLCKKKAVQINIDSHWFTLLLDNLFLNALKFSTENDVIKLTANLNDSNFSIAISDTGIGIKEKDLPFLFDRTYKVSDSRTPGPKNGCGLGLSIVKKIVEMHQGTITCESKIGKGTNFVIDIPIIH